MGQLEWVSWNGTTAVIDFYLVEVQAGPDITGAFENMDPTEREAAYAFDRDIADSIKYDY